MKKVLWGAVWLVTFPVACVAVVNAFVGLYIAAIMLWGSLGESSIENALALAAAAVATPSPKDRLCVGGFIG